MITESKAKKIKAISREASLNLMEELGSLDLTFEETFAGALTCASLISAAIISSYAKRMNTTLGEVMVHFIKNVDELIKKGSS